jgi:hypothetical protein
MTISSHDRRLVRLEEKGWAKDNSLMRVVVGAERLRKRRRRAALALAAFAQDLAGVEPPAVVPEPPRDEPVRGTPMRDAPPPPSARPFAAPPPPSRPVWGPDNRPGPHDVLTWEEVMRLPWINGNESN